MLATNNTILEDASETVYRLSEDEKLRMQNETREDFYRLQRTMQMQYENVNKQLQEALAALQEMEAAIQEKEALLQEKKAAIQEKEALLQEKKALLREKKAAIQEKDATIACYQKALEKHMQK